MAEAAGRVEDGGDHPEERDGGWGCGKEGGAEGMELEKTKRYLWQGWRSGKACYEAARRVFLGVGTSASQCRKPVS